jgi:hypothetical protein
MIQLAWRLLMFQKKSALAQWFRARTENSRGTRKTMIVALARKLLIALWRLVREGVVPDGVVLRPAQCMVGAEVTPLSCRLEEWVRRFEFRCRCVNDRHSAMSALRLLHTDERTLIVGSCSSASGR